MAGPLLSAALIVVVVVVGVFCPTHILASSSYQSLSHHHTHTSHQPHNLHSKSSALDVFPEMKFHDGRKDHKKHHGRVNTSFSYSVAPQPVQDTPEVAMARRQFLHIYNSIRDAITAAQHRHNATTSSHHHSNHHHRDREHKQSKPRQLYDHEHQVHRNREHEHDDPRLLYDHDYYHRQLVDSSSTTSRPLFLPHPAVATMHNNSIFPNPKLEPEYFLPSIPLDPLLVQRLDPPLPQDAHIQQIRPLEFNNTRGTCYEIVLLEPQLKVNVNPNQLTTSLESSDEDSGNEATPTPTPQSNVAIQKTEIKIGTPVINSNTRPKSSPGNKNSLPAHFTIPKFFFQKQ